MKFTMSINEASSFEDGGAAREVARILRGVADLLDDVGAAEHASGNARDANGDAVGVWALECGKERCY